jgi:hypothetical protein
MGRAYWCDIFIDHQVCFLMVVCTLWGTLGGTLWYLLWIRRKTHGGKLIGLLVFNTPCIKLRVTCVYVLLLVPIILSFQSRSLKAVVLIIGYWSIFSTWILFGMINIKFGYMDCVDEYTMIIIHPEWNLIFFAVEEGTITAYDMDYIRFHIIPAHVFHYGRCSVKQEFIFRPFYLHYVPLLLDSLAEQ